MARTIAIVGGTGPEGSGLALRWARAGQNVIVGSRDAARAEQKAGEIFARCEGKPQIRGTDNPSAVAASDIVVLTVPFSAHADTLKQLKGSFRPGTVLIDATVPLASTVGGRPTRTVAVWQGSAAQQAAELVPAGVKVAAAFQNIGADLLNSDRDADCDIICCSDHDDARKLAMELAELIPGVRSVDGGRLEMARHLEQITALLIDINIRYKAHSAAIRITGLELKKKI